MQLNPPPPPLFFFARKGRIGSGCLGLRACLFCRAGNWPIEADGLLLACFSPWRKSIRGRGADAEDLAEDGGPAVRAVPGAAEDRRHRHDAARGGQAGGPRGREGLPGPKEAAGRSGGQHTAVVKHRDFPKWLALVRGNMDQNLRFSGGAKFDPHPPGSLGIGRVANHG